MAINLVELQTLLNQAATTAATEKDIRKSLGRVENLVNNITKELASIYELLDGTAPVGKPRQTHAPKETTESDPQAPYGRRKDGTPKGKPGRSKAVEA